MLREPQSSPGDRSGIGTNLPFSSTVYTDVWPTDSCFNLCLGGDGMWYQQSPATGGQTWMQHVAASVP